MLKAALFIILVFVAGCIVSIILDTDWNDYD
jgi:hypothetical protein